MKIIRYAIGLMVLLSSIQTLHAQELIIHQRQLHLRHIQGVIVDSTGATVEYAVVELRDAKDHHVIASTFADGRGKFAFEDKKRRTQWEVRASLKGFNMVQYSLKITRFGDNKMRLVLTPAA